MPNSESALISAGLYCSAVGTLTPRTRLSTMEVDGASPATAAIAAVAVSACVPVSLDGPARRDHEARG